MSETGKIGRALGRRYAISLIFGTVAPVVLFGGLCLVPLAASVVHEDLLAPTFWCCFLSIPLGLPPIAIVVALLFRIRTNRQLDALLAPVGSGSAWMLSGRQWRGSRGSRQLHASYMRGTFTLRLTGSPLHELRAGRDNPLARGAAKLLGAEPVALSDGLIAFTDAPAELLELDRLRDALMVLLEDDGRTLRNVHLDPAGHAELILRHPTLKHFELLPTLLDALQTALEAAESPGSS